MMKPMSRFPNNQPSTKSPRGQWLSLVIVIVGERF